MSRCNLEPNARRVLDHLVREGTITNMEANIVLKVRSVSRRITDIQRAGYSVAKLRCKDSTGQRYVKYALLGYRAILANGAGSVYLPRAALNV